MQQKLLAPIVIVAFAAIVANFALGRGLQDAVASRDLVDARAAAVVDEALAAEAAWRRAGVIARSAAFQEDPSLAWRAFDAEIAAARRRLALLDQMNRAEAPDGAGRPGGWALAPLLSDWTAAAKSSARTLERDRRLLDLERRLASGFAAKAVAALAQASRMRDDMAERFVSRVEAAAGALWAAAGVAILLGLYVGRATAAPLERLAREAEAVANGDGTARFSPMRRADEIGALAGALARMVARLREKTRAIERMAFVDPDTGLPTRARLQAEIAEREAKGDGARTLLVVEIDGWDRVQGIYGAGLTTKAALGVASRLQAALTRLPARGPAPAKPFLARMSANAYAALFSESQPDKDAIDAMTTALASAFDAPFAVDDRLIWLSPRFAVSSSDVAGAGEDLVNSAVLALEEARDGRGRAVAVFTPALREGVIQRRDMEERIRGALEQNAFELHFQPFVTLDGGQVWGAEALLRWRGEDGAFIPPGRFIPVAEEAGFISAIDDWVVAEACAAARRWRDAGLELVVSANVSPLRFERDGFAEQTALALAQAALPSQLLKLEITETAAMADPERTRAILMPLKEMGVQLAIDDFGSGYSNLSMLSRMPFDCLKIDRTLLPADDRDADAAQICRAVAELGRHLGLWTIIEGVETAWQAEFARRVGGHAVQGFYYCRPKPEAEFLAYVERSAAPARLASGAW